MEPAEVSMVFMNAMTRKPVVGILSFDGYVSMYAETLRYVSWKLQHEGCNVIRIGCDGVLNACTSLNSLGKNGINNTSKDSICKRCKQSQTNIYAKTVSNVSSCNEQNNQADFDFLKDVEKKLRKNSTALSVLGLTYKGLPLCKIAFFDFAILFKVSPNCQLNDLAISRFIDGVKDLIVLQNYLEPFVKNSQLTHLVYVNGNYSPNTFVRLFCENKKIICLSIEPQLTSQHILNYIFFKRDRLELSPEALFTVNSVANIDPKYLGNVIKSFSARITGGDFNAYTSLDNVSCDQNQSAKIKTFFDSYTRVHSFFMSSEDELVPHIVTHNFLNEIDEESRVVYKNQFEFTQLYLAEAAKKPDIGFILRLHPRMAVNKRDAFESEEHIRYKGLLEQMVSHPNILILLGDNKVSSYFIISKSSLVVVSWSTIGLEALMMGVPVVSAFPNNLMYPLRKISNQPQNFKDLKSALFTKSNFGVADDILLVSWIAIAYEGQFFPTLAARGRGGRLGVVYRLIYRTIDEIGAYSLFAQIVDKLCFRDTIFSGEDLLIKQVKKNSLLNNEASQLLINAYRIKVEVMLSMYKKKLFNEPA